MKAGNAAVDSSLDDRDYLELHVSRELLRARVCRRARARRRIGRGLTSRSRPAWSRWSRAAPAMGGRGRSARAGERDSERAVELATRTVASGRKLVALRGAEAALVTTRSGTSTRAEDRSSGGRSARDRLARRRRSGARGAAGARGDATYRADAAAAAALAAGGATAAAHPWKRISGSALPIPAGSRAR